MYSGVVARRITSTGDVVAGEQFEGVTTGVLSGEVSMLVVSGVSAVFVGGVAEQFCEAPTGLIK